MVRDHRTPSLVDLQLALLGESPEAASLSLGSSNSSIGIPHSSSYQNLSLTGFLSYFTGRDDEDESTDDSTPPAFIPTCKTVLPPAPPNSEAVANAIHAEETIYQAPRSNSSNIKKQAVTSETLRQCAAAVPADLSPHDLHMIAEEVKQLTYDLNGAGAAAPQIGFPYRMCAISVPQSRMTDETEDLVKTFSRPTVVVNPEISASKGATEITAWERCLSVPGMTAAVSRPSIVQLTGQDVDRNNAFSNMEINGQLSRLIQHEVDHLDGILYTDRAIPGTIMEVEKLTESTSLGHDMCMTNNCNWQF